jgi:hypothetical protein
VVEQQLENYASPILRAAVFHQLFPGAQVDYTVVSILEAFPDGHRSSKEEAEEAIICRITLPDGRVFSAAKEVPRKEYRRGSWTSIEQTPEEWVKNETKALGRAMRDAGIPQKLSELTMLMRWWRDLAGPAQVVSSHSVPPPHVDPRTGEIDPEAVDGADAGASPLDEYRDRLALLSGPEKAELSKKARAAGISNLINPGDHLDEAVALLEQARAGAEFGAEEEEEEEPF